MRSQFHVPAYTRHELFPKTFNYCVVIPVINEGERIGKLLARMAALLVPAQADIVIVDGGSTDGSLLESKISPTVRTVLTMTGPGRLSAQLRCAYDYALEQGYEGVITIDGNNKDDPAAIPRFISALREDGYDFVQASRFLPGGRAENTPVLRDLAIRWVHAPLLSAASGFKWTDTTQGFRAYSARMLRDARLSVFREVFDGYELLAYLSYRAPRLGYRCVELPTTRAYPASGPTPTKIGGLCGSLAILAVLLRACLGVYNPYPVSPR